MKTETNNLQVAGWTDDPAKQEEFFAEVEPIITRASNRWPSFYGVRMEREDIAQESRLKLLQQMHNKDADGPFAKDSPKETADFLKDNFKISELVRTNARNSGKKQRGRAKSLEQNQAEIFDKIVPKEMPKDYVKRLSAVCESLPQISKISNLTAGERKAFCKEMIRRLEVDDLSPAEFDHAVEATGIASSEQREYNEYHDKNGHSSDRDRKALSRALTKVKDTFTQAKILTLLMMSLALSSSLVLSSASHQERSDHQDYQCSLSHQNNLARQGNLIPNARAHQTM
jgi:hypothetical protein